MMRDPHLKSRIRHRISRGVVGLRGSSKVLKRGFLRILAPIVDPREPGSPFFETLHRLLEADGDVSLRELMDAAGEQTYGLLILVTGLASFIPGISIGGGLAATILGLEMAWGAPHPWLPRRLEGVQIHRGRMKEALARFEGWLDRLGRKGRSGRPLNRRWMGAMIAWTAFLLMLPVPPIIPLGNAIPAATLCLMGAALLEERPRWAWLGALGMLVTTIYLALSFDLILRGLVKLFA